MGAEGYLEGVIQGIYSVADEDLDSRYNSLRERVFKIVADRDVKSLGLQREGKEDKVMGAPVMASREEEAQLAGSSQLASTPSSTDAMLGVQRTRFFILLEIDGLFMWQWYGQKEPFRDNLRLTV